MPSKCASRISFTYLSPHLHLFTGATLCCRIAPNRATKTRREWTHVVAHRCHVSRHSLPRELAAAPARRLLAPGRALTLRSKRARRTRAPRQVPTRRQRRARALCRREAEAELAEKPQQRAVGAPRRAVWPAVGRRVGRRVRVVRPPTGDLGER